MRKFPRPRWLSTMLALAMLLSLTPVVGAVAQPVEPLAANYGFIPNSGEASVSKVDLLNGTQVARYWTTADEGDNTANAARAWRTSRIAMDSDSNAWVLNVGGDAYLYGPPGGLVGEVVRIQADITGLTTNNDHANPLPFGTDQAVQVFPIGVADEMPRAIAICPDDPTCVWVGFYGSGRLAKYQYDEGTAALGDESFTEIDSWSTAGPDKLNFYEMKFAPDGKLWISSRNSTPTRAGNYGVWSFDPTTGIFTEEWDVNSPYSLLISDTGQVYATSYSTVLWIAGTGTVPITGAQNLRGMSFDSTGKIWIASTTGGSGGDRVCWYDPVGGASGFITLTVGNTPVGVGLDASGLMWAVCRTDSNPVNGFVEAFDPLTGLYVDDIAVGFRPYAYGDFAVPAPRYEICGTKLHADTGEGLEGWEITLSKWDDELGDWVEYATTMTDEYGDYCFEDLLEGRYKVEETLQDGWVQTAPAPDGFWDITLPGEQYDSEARYDFENAPLYDICGYKYLADTDTGLENWVIELYAWDDEAGEAGDWVKVDEDLTDDMGHYCFEDLRAGNYKVVEVQQPGWTQTYPNPNQHLVTLPGESEEPVSYDFRNMPEMDCWGETAMAAQGEPGVFRFVEAPGNWFTYIEYYMEDVYTMEAPRVYPIYAGQYNLAGELEVYDDGVDVFVRYKIFGGEDYMPGYCGSWSGLTEYHLQVVDKFSQFNPYRTYSKKTGYGSIIPGQLTDQGYFDPKTDDTDWIQATAGTLSGKVYIAAHSVAWWCGYPCEAENGVMSSAEAAGILGLLE